MSSRARPRLSKAILEMKFMQRSRAKVDKEMEEAEGRAMYSSEITDKMLNQNYNFIQEPSYIHCEGLIEGRLSFRGMNPEIERLLELEEEERLAKVKHEQPAEVSVEEMAKFYHAQQAPAAAKTMQKKFQNKRKINNESNFNAAGLVVEEDGEMSLPISRLKIRKRGKFQKPRNDD